MKKSLSLILAVVLVLACALSAVQADDYSVTASNPTAKAGETATVTFTLAGFPEVTALGLFFDAVADGLTPFEGAHIVGKPTIEDFNDVDGLACAYDKGLDLNGEAAFITFKIDEDAAPGDYEVDVYYSVEIASGTVDGNILVTITVEGDEPASSEEPSEEEPSEEEPSEEEPSELEPEPADPAVYVCGYEIEAGLDFDLEVEFENFANDTAVALKYAFDETAFEFVNAEWKLEGAVVEATDSPAVVAFEEPVDINGLVFVLTLRALEDAEGDYEVDFEVTVESAKDAPVEAVADVTIVPVEEPIEVEVEVVPFRAYILEEAAEIGYDALCGDVYGNRMIGTLDPDTEYYISALFDNGACLITTFDDQETILGYAYLGAFVTMGEDDGDLEEVVAKGEYTSYKRPGGEEYGSTDPEDVCFVVFKGEEYAQAFYPVSGCYKLGWFNNDDLYGTEPVEPAEDVEYDFGENASDVKVNERVVGASVRVFTPDFDLSTGNLRWSINVIVEKDGEDTYKVVSVEVGNGSDPNIVLTENQLIVSVHSDGADQNVEGKAQALALEKGDILRITGLDGNNTSVCKLKNEQPIEESSEEPSEEPSKEESSNPPTPPQGDAGMIALAIVSVVTLAGVVIVKKSK